MTSKFIRKLINRAHPNGPTDWHSDFASLSAADSALGWAKEIERSHTKCVDWSTMKPLTDEDYILEDDIDKHSQIEFPEQCLYQINSASVIGPWGDVLDSNGCLLTQFTPQNGNAGEHSGLLRLRYPNVRNLSGRVFNLAQPGSVNYYHWLTQILSSLRLFDNSIDSIDWFIVPAPKRFHLATLAALGVKEDRIVVLDESVSYRCEVLFQTTVSHSISPAPQAVDWLRQLYLSNQTPHNKKRKLYISRGDTGWRKVVNEAELEAFLRNHGYQSVQLAELKFGEQTALLNSASHVISPHGAGFTNLCFCQPNCHVLEIFPPKWTSLCYLYLSDIVGADYWFCNAEALGLTKSQIDERRNANAEEHHKLGGLLPISVPLEKIERFVTQT